MKTNRGLIPGEGPVHRRKGSRWLHLLFLPLLLCAGLWFLSLLPPSKFDRSPHLGSLRPHDISAHHAWCNLTDVSSPPKDGLKPSDHFMGSAHVKLQVERLSRAVRIGTESYDNNGDVEEDPRWQVFDTFHQELEELFPLV
jgi:Gly-Xaa carboxypeptidase